MNKVAVIDLGTNTFHLLIAQPNSKEGFEIVYKERRFVKLAAGGIHKIEAGSLPEGY